ncbi:MAG TPA: hypothetical protein VFZ44_04705 [Pyrinomonadaceae bacterium]
MKSPRRALLLALLLAVPVIARADLHARRGSQSRPARATRKEPARQPEVEAFVVEMNSAPPDVAADALIRLAGSDRVIDSAWKKQLVERAFVLAGDAPAPVRRKTASRVTLNVDTSAGYLTYAYDLGLDTLSLRARAVRSMLALDPQRGLELFGQISLKVEPLKCGDALVYDVSDFYALLAEVARSSFTGEVARQGARLRFMLPYVEAVNSPAQIGPAARAILSAQLSSDDVATLSNALAHSLGSMMAADDRSFTSAVEEGGVTADVASLARELGKRRDNVAAGLVDTYRKFFRAGLTAERCAENVPRGKTPYYLTQANDVLLKDSPLRLDELIPRGVGGRASLSVYWQKPDSEQLLNDYKELRFAPDAEERAEDGRLPTRADAGTAEWEAQLRRLLADLESWSGSGEKSQLDYINQQQVIYHGLLEITPPGQARGEVLASWLKSLKGARSEGNAEVQRRLWVSYLVKAVASSPQEMRDDFLMRMVYSGDALISAWARVARLKI